MNGPIQHVLARLQGVKRAGEGYLAQCPAHEDHKQSLSVSEGKDGRVIAVGKVVDGAVVQYQVKVGRLDRVPRLALIELLRAGGQGQA